jgi:tetratricopeptide (TPR) repeat protein
LSAAEPAAAPSLDAMLAHARQLAAGSDDEAAKLAFLKVLQRDPAHLEALLEIARLALRSGHRSAAQTAYAQAAACHPSSAAPRVNLGNLALEAGEFEAAKAWFSEAMTIAPDLAAAHLGLARALTALGDEAGAERCWELGLADGALVSQPCRGERPGVRVLALVSAKGGNIPTRYVLDDTLFDVTALHVEGWPMGRPLPPCDVIFNVIADADLCAEALTSACAIARSAKVPVVNRPDAVRATGRADMARLANVPGVLAPKVERVWRQTLLRRGVELPVLLRSSGYHTGQHFVRVDHAKDLERAISALPGDALFAIEPLDALGPDGAWRKYRVMAIEGALYPLHLAISDHWKVHYYSADMTAPERRAEEAAFLADMETVLGVRAIDALSIIVRRLDLDYAGIDFALAPDGRVLLFEANAGMVIQRPGAQAIWDYRRPAIERALAAAQALLRSKAATAIRFRA